MTLTLNAGIQFFCKTLQLMMLYYQTKFGYKQICSSEDISPRCDLDIEDSEPFFLQDTLAQDTLPNHTKFGDKKFFDSEDIIRTNIH